jgi:hypothetical protein
VFDEVGYDLGHQGFKLRVKIIFLGVNGAMP